MEVPAMEDIKKSDVHLTSAAAFVEGGIQDACDDACSICLEAFCDSDPSTVTSCKHEFHLQCILECQELLEAVEWERSFRFNPSRNATIFHHPTLGDFELQHLPMGASDAELEERIIQHLAAAAAMGRARHIARREGQRNRASAQGRPQFLVYSTHPNAPSATLASSSPDQSGPISAITLAFPSPLSAGEESSQLTASSTLPSTQAEPVSALASGLSVVSHQQGSSLNNRRSPTQSSPSSQDRPGPSAFQSFSESLKSRFNAVSMRYNESISKSTRGWKERLFSRKTSMADLGSEVKKEVNAGIATVSRMMERLETRDGSRTTDASVSNSLDGSAPASDNRQRSDTDGDSSLSNPNVKASCAAGFSSN